MDSSILTASAVLGGSVAVLGGVLAGNAFSTARLLGSTGPTPISELGEMLQEVRGSVVSSERATAPVSGRSCVYWRLLVEEQRRTRWEVVVDQREGRSLSLDDGTGRVRLDPRECEPVATAPGRVRTGVFANPSPEWTELLAKIAPPAHAPAGAFLRWREEVFEEGDVLTAIGRARPGEGGWELVPEGQQLVLSDRDDAQVVRHHRRSGQRWGLISIGGAVLAGWSIYTLGG